VNSPNSESAVLSITRVVGFIDKNSPIILWDDFTACKFMTFTERAAAYRALLVDVYLLSIADARVSSALGVRSRI